MPPEVTSAYNNFDFIMKKQGVDIERFFQLKKFGAAAGISTVLERGDVEAAYTWEAHTSKLLTTGKYRVLLLPRDELNRLLNTKVKMLGWIGALDAWIGKNQPLIPKLRAAWQEMIKGVQRTKPISASTRKRYSVWKRPMNLNWAGAARASSFCRRILAGRTRSILDIEKKYLRESTEMGIFPKEGTGVIDAMFVP